LNCFDAEERGKLNNLYLTLPISRGTLIKARYAISLILQFVGIVAGIILTLVFSRLMHGRILFGEFTFTPTFEVMVFLVCGSLLYCALLSLMIHPMLFKKGYAKAKILGYALPIFGSTVVIVAFWLVANRVEAVGEFVNSAFGWILGNIVLTSAIMLSVTALLLAVSYKLSQKLYAKREF